MTITARVATGVQAIWVVIAERGRTLNAIIPREALERCWDVGPEQEDLLRAFEAHKEDIEAEMRRQAGAAHGELFLIKDLGTAASRRDGVRRAQQRRWPRSAAPTNCKRVSTF